MPGQAFLFFGRWVFWYKCFPFSLIGLCVAVCGVPFSGSEVALFNFLKKYAIKRTIAVFENQLALGALGLASTPPFSQRLPGRRSIQTCFSALLLPHLAVVCVWVSYSHNKRFKRIRTRFGSLILKSRLSA